jgi:hypothetical protein
MSSIPQPVADRVAKLEARIDELQNEIDKQLAPLRLEYDTLQWAIAAFAITDKPAPAPETAPTAHPLRAPLFRKKGPAAHSNGISVSDRIMATLTNSQRPMSGPEIRKAIGSPARGTVTGLLSKLARAGRIVHEDTGKWAAP